jgi:hypothetical protein
MTRNEFNNLFKTIQSEFNDFGGDYDEWYKILSNYSYNDVLKNLRNYKGNTPPIYLTLIKNLKEEEKIEDWITCCDICKQKIVIHNNDMEEYEKHHRKCSKIDFIDRIVFRYKGQHIASVKYYQMSDAELEENYQKTLAYYRKHRGDNKNIIKSIESIDIL